MFREHGGTVVAAIIAAVATIIATAIVTRANQQVVHANEQRDLQASRVVALEANIAVQAYEITELKKQLDTLRESVQTRSDPTSPVTDVHTKTESISLISAGKGRRSTIASVTHDN